MAPTRKAGDDSLRLPICRIGSESEGFVSTKGNSVPWAPGIGWPFHQQSQEPESPAFRPLLMKRPDGLGHEWHLRREHAQFNHDIAQIDEVLLRLFELIEFLRIQLL